MDERTEAVVTALQAVAQHVPNVACGIADRTLSTTKLVEFADLLAGLGQLLREYADEVTEEAGCCQPTGCPPTQARS